MERNCTITKPIEEQQPETVNLESERKAETGGKLTIEEKTEGHTGNQPCNTEVSNQKFLHEKIQELCEGQKKILAVLTSINDHLIGNFSKQSDMQVQTNRALGAVAGGLKDFSEAVLCLPIEKIVKK